MSQSNTGPETPDTASAPEKADETLDAEEYGSLTVEDEPNGTVDPADLAGTASDADDEVGYEPKYSEADEHGEDAD